MKRFVKKATVLILCIVILVTMTGCPSPWYYGEMKKPLHKFPGSTWSTENGEIYFYVDYEYTERFSGYIETSKGTLATVSPLYTNMFGELYINETKCKFFADEGFGVDGYPHLSFLSEEMPTGEDEVMIYDDIIKEYTLVDFSIDCKSKNHFTAKVVESKIYEVGTTFEFYRTDVE